MYKSRDIRDRFGVDETNSSSSAAHRQQRVVFDYERETRPAHIWQSATFSPTGCVAARRCEARERDEHYALRTARYGGLLCVFVCVRTQMRLLMPAHVQVSCDVRCPTISRHICYSMCPQSIYPCARLHDHRQRIDRCGAHTAQKSDGVIVVHMCMHIISASRAKFGHLRRFRHGAAAASTAYRTTNPAGAKLAADTTRTHGHAGTTAKQKTAGRGGCMSHIV